jgi:hypothetical protein
MRQEAEWWRGNHPDAAEHRKFMEQAAKEDAERALARVPVRKALPPPRPRRKRQPVVEILKNGDMAISEGTVTGADLNAFGQFLKTELADFSKDVQAALNERLKWRGTWRTGEKFAVNDLVQDKGTVFVAVAQTEGRPGADAGWRMLVKTQERPAK